MKIYCFLIILFIWNIIIILNKKRKVVKKEKIFNFNLGSSHSLVSFNYKNKSNYNLAENSQTFYYDYLILEKYFDKLIDKSYCFLTISYFSFASKKYWLKEDITKYYKLLDMSKFDKEQKIECILYKYFPLIWSIRKKFIKVSNEIDPMIRIKGHKKKLQENRNLDFNIELIEKIIEKCKEKSIKVILITTPFKKEYNNFFEKDLLKNNFYDNIEKIRSKYNLLYFDFSHDYKNFDEKRDFRDYDHLNEEGSKKFMEILDKKLIENKIDIKL